MTDLPTRSDTPLAPVGGYCLDLYCDHINDAHGYDEFPHSFFAERGSACRRVAREQGWKFGRDGYATCPKCAAAIRSTKDNT